MAVSGAPADVLLQTPWLPVNIDSCRLLAKSWFGETAYHILLTDVRCVWEEQMDAAGIHSRAQELNRRLRAPVAAFFAHLRQALQPQLTGSDTQPNSDAQMTVTRRDASGFHVCLKIQLAGVPLRWELVCSPAPLPLVCQQLLRPLVDMSRALQRHVEQLSELLHQKDEQILDYQDNGGTLSRDRLQTNVFQDRTYREEFLSEVLPTLCSEHEDTCDFSSDLQHLYAAVVAAHNNARKRKMPELPLPHTPHTPSSDEDEQVRTSPDDSVGDKMAAQQPASVPPQPTEHSSSKPKKKKVVGLFR